MNDFYPTPGNPELLSEDDIDRANEVVRRVVEGAIACDFVIEDSLMSIFPDFDRLHKYIRYFDARQHEILGEDLDSMEVVFLNHLVVARPRKTNL